MKMGFIGAGQMARALVVGFARRAPNFEFWVSDPSSYAIDQMTRTVAAISAKLNVEPDNVQLVRRCDCIVLAIKPQSCQAAFEGLIADTADRIFVSVMAGISTQQLADWLQTDQIVRVMPNAPCLVGAGAIAIAHNVKADQTRFQLIKSYFEHVGTVVELPEYLLHAVTGLSGSGPAYVYLFIESLIDAGVLNGIPRDVAATLAIQTVKGAIETIEQSPEHLVVLRDQVSSPGGTTVHGLRHLEQLGFRNSIAAAVSAATRRSIELGEGVDRSSGADT